MDTSKNVALTEGAAKKIAIDEVINILAKALQSELSAVESQLVGQYYLESASGIIFKYRPMLYDYDVNAVKNNKLWFSELSTLNDPFEAYAIIDHDQFALSVLNSDSELKKSLSNMPYAVRQRARKLAVMESKRNSRDLLEGMRQDLSISCFSERNDSILMWGHYANKHNGICVAYSILDMSERGKAVIPVNYCEQLPVLVEYSEYGICRFFLESIRTKAKEWSYEKEWRCIQDKNACGENWNGNGALLDVASPKAVYLGCHSDVELVEQMKRICFDLIEIPLYKMEQSQTEYKLFPMEIK